MSYDIRLKDRVSGETIDLPVKHVMTGGNYKAAYDERTGTFSPMPISEAWLNVTYNYAPYYYEATEGDPRFAHKDDCSKDPERIEYGIRGIYSKSGAQSIQMLQDMIARIEEKYKQDGEWIRTTRDRVIYQDEAGNEVDSNEVFLRQLRGVDLGDIERIEYTEEISEGPNADYWESTAANAIKPLYQLIAMAELRPDGVWDGD